MLIVPVFVLAALAEIVGCFAFWAWLRQGTSPLWVAPGMVFLALFAWLLTHSDSEFAGRSYAAYGGIYFAMALVWLWQVERQTPDRWDLIGGAICLLGTAVILFGPRTARTA